MGLWAGNSAFGIEQEGAAGVLGWRWRGRAGVGWGLGSGGRQGPWGTQGLSISPAYSTSTCIAQGPLHQNLAIIERAGWAEALVSQVGLGGAL